MVCAWRPVDRQNEKCDFGAVEFLWKDEFGRKCAIKPENLVVGSTYIIVIYIWFKNITIIKFYDKYLVCAWRPIDRRNEKSDFGTVEFLWKNGSGRKCAIKPENLVMGSTYIIVIYIWFKKMIMSWWLPEYSVHITVAQRICCAHTSCSTHSWAGLFSLCNVLSFFTLQK